MDPVTIFTVVRLAFDSSRAYENPLWDCELTVTLTSPGGRSVIYDGYWDGGCAWRAAVSLDEIGTWGWVSSCSDPTNAGLHGRTGSLECRAYTGDNPLYAHGPLRVAASGTHLEHADGKPFFWLADTAWNGVIRGGDDNWAKYLDLRAGQKFTAIQFVTPHWRGDATDEHGRTACTEAHPIRIHPEYFRDKDRRIAMVNQRGLIAAPVVLWSLQEGDLGYKLPTEDAIRLARYLVARYGADQVVWLLGGDGRYRAMGIERWKQIGRVTFARKHDRPVTLHPCGVSWIGEEFRNEDWFEFISYQSGHGDGAHDLRWLVDGPPAKRWNHRPLKPVINLEPNYEGAFGYQHHTRFDDRHVRRAAYWSCLVSPTAGITYGHDRIWNWNLQAGPSEGHGDWGGGCIEPWHTALDTPGIRSMTVLRRFFESIDWTALRPAPELLADQPGEDEPERFIAAARTDDGRLAVIYAPTGGSLKLNADEFDQRQWFDPRTGEWSDAGSFDTPNDEDWLLVLRKE